MSLCHASVPPLSPTVLRQPLSCFLPLWSPLYFLDVHVNELILYVLCLAFFTRCNKSEIHPCCSRGLWFISVYWWVAFHCMDIPQFIHSPMKRHVGCFYIGATTNKAATNFCVQIFVRTYVHIYVISLGWSRRAIKLFSFQSGFLILQSHLQCTRAPDAPQPCQHWLWSIFYLYILGLHPPRMEVSRLGVEPEL